MAYWSVPFQSLAGINYDVRIFGKSGSNATLQPAANPLTIQEDTSDDMFLPVRRQTGYVRVVVGSSDDYQSIFPTSSVSRPVNVYRSGTVVWTGFLKAQNFNVPYTDKNITIALPITDALSVLEGMEYNPYIYTSSGTTSLANILDDILEIVNGYANSSFSRLYFDMGTQMLQQSYGPWLAARVSRTLFYTLDEDGNYTPRYTYMEVLENICTLLGVSLRIYNMGLYFTAVDDTSRGRQFKQISKDDLMDLEEGSTVSGTTVSMSWVSVFGSAANPYASTQQKQLVKQGVREAIVSAERQITSQSWSADTQEISDKKFLTNQWSKRTVTEGTNVYTLYTLINQSMEIINNGDWTITPYNDMNLHIWDLVKDTQYNFNWLVGFDVVNQGSSGSDPLNMVIRSRYPVYLKNSIVELQMSADVYVDGQPTDSLIGVGIGIACGGYLFDGTYWQEDTGGIGVGTGIKGSIYCNRSMEQDNCADYEGFGANVTAGTLSQVAPSHLFGYIEVRIGYMNSSDHPTSPISITSLAINIKPNDRETADLSGNAEYTASGSYIFSKTDKKQTLFISDNSTNAIDNKVTGLNYDGSSSYNPHQALANRMIDQDGATRNVMKLQLRSDRVSLSPMSLVARSYDGKSYYPVSISHDYREDVDDVILEEIQ